MDEKTFTTAIYNLHQVMNCTEEVPVEEEMLLLKKARSAIEDGWVRNAYRAIDGQGASAYCMIGAVVWTGDGQSAVIAAVIERLRKAVENYTGRPWSLPAFNDHMATAQSDVLEVFDRAIESLRDSV